MQRVRPAAGNARKSGGENYPDTVLSKQPFWLNGAHIVKDGTIVGPPALARIGRHFDHASNARALRTDANPASSTPTEGSRTKAGASSHGTLPPFGIRGEVESIRLSSMWGASR